MLHFTLDGAFADAEPGRDRLVVELFGYAQQEHLPAPRLELEQRSLDDRKTLRKVDDELGRIVAAREIVLGKRRAGALLGAPAKTIARQVRRDLE